ncbi:ATP-dependent helicase [Chryseobacterium culicis]|uniref:UvrD-helicase domain-containing protein n=1 Tax=Chryseobacterium culicis TaxID=680127 RepID=UPI001876DF26|nr:ATP-dependent helicase [Chryseobacterium culicis]MBE4949855.1 ATP-dependent helicase [Chryseobacterium culicis]
MPITTITSETIIDTEQHFRIFAGPGAGKTHWLVNHMRHLLQSSNKFGATKKIACITYTNVAVETIVKRLQFGADRIEVSTIHAFLYSNVIKPYIGSIAEEFGFNAIKMDGHEEHRASRSKITEWLDEHPGAPNLRNPYTLNQLKALPYFMTGLANWLSTIDYKLNGDQIVLSVDNSKAYYFMPNGTRRNFGAANCLNILSTDLLSYKKLFWARGVLHHEDVLYFSYILLTRYPFIVEVLKTKYPYFFIDEFQDTSPIQARILKLIGASGTVTGIIGDIAQSIYSFQGAEPAQFTDYHLEGLKDYRIIDNRRSTNEIVGILNHIRKDMGQEPLRNVPGERCNLLIGNYRLASEFAQGICGDNLTILSWDNITARELGSQMVADRPDHNLVEDLQAIDNSDRRNAILSCISAAEFAREKRFKDALKEMSYNYLHIRNKNDRKAMALDGLSKLLSKYDEYHDQPLLDFYNHVRTDVRNNFPAITRGRAKEFYERYSFQQLAVCIRIDNERSPSKTIHKSKGDEFDNVLVVLKKEEHFDFLVRQTLRTEEHRIFYVAVSRARERLFISVPTLEEGKLRQIEHLFEINNL